MRKFTLAVFIVLLAFTFSPAQSGRIKTYSESSPQSNKTEPQQETSKKLETIDDDVIRIETDLVVIPVQISTSRGKPVSDIKKEEFKIFENGVEQEVAYFSNDDQPITVALVLDMSYSSLFKLSEIQSAALAFINQLRANDKVMVVSFDEKVRVLCEATNNRTALRWAIEGTQIASGTSLYSALDVVLSEKLSKIPGRKAVVLFSDGVDTSSAKITSADILNGIGASDVLIYPIQYDTYDDVQKSRKENFQVFRDDNNRPYVVETPKIKGEREEDYRNANEFLKEISGQTGGRVYGVSSTTNLNRAFRNIADELRKIYSLGYYPSTTRKIGVRYAVNVRVYRPDLKIRAKEGYTWRKNSGKTQ
jgi:VWFA-related protein